MSMTSGQIGLMIGIGVPSRAKHKIQNLVPTTSDVERLKDGTLEKNSKPFPAGFDHPLFSKTHSRILIYVHGT